MGLKKTRIKDKVVDQGKNAQVGKNKTEQIHLWYERSGALNLRPPIQYNQIQKRKWEVATFIITQLEPPGILTDKSLPRLNGGTMVVNRG